jgi:hypothetical protein
LCPLTLGKLADIAAERWGDKVAVKSLYQDCSLTFRQVKDKVIAEVTRVTLSRLLRKVDDWRNDSDCPGDMQENLLPFVRNGG